MDKSKYTIWYKDNTLSGVTRVGDTGAATEGVTPLFFPKNLATFFGRQFCGVTRVSFLMNN